jgi:chaperonin GroES
MAKKFRPVSDTVVVKKVEVSETTEGGVLIPEASKPKSTEGFVVAVGPGRMLESGQRSKPQVKVDDHIVFGAYAGTEVKVNNREFTLLREDEILTVLEEEEVPVEA